VLCITYKPRCSRFLSLLFVDTLVVIVWPRFECDFITEVLVLDVVAQCRKSINRASQLGAQHVGPESYLSL